MNLKKQIARNYIFPVVKNLHLEKSFRLLSGNSILNVMFHGVVTKDGSTFSPRHMHTHQFEKLLQYFKREFEILSLQEAFENYRQNIKPKRKAITISFDDGYKNNLSVAIPLLQKYGIKTTFFISGVCAEKMEVRTLWTDLIACLKRFHKNEIIEIDGKKFINFHEESDGYILDHFLKSMSPEKRESSLNSLINKYHLYDDLEQVSRELWELLDIDDIKSLSRFAGVEIASHGYLHHNLGEIGRQEAKLDMEKSKVLIEGAINKGIDMIAFPDGSYTKETKNDAQSLGFDKQLAVIYKYKEDIEDPRILNRHGISATTTFESNVFFLNKSFRALGYN